MITRRKTENFSIGKIKIGSDNPVTVQSMVSVPSTDILGTVEQVKRLKEAGCDIVRIAVPDMEAVKLVDAIKSEVDIPLVADIHFDYKLALACADAGIDKIRINPGNIGDDSRVKEVANACANKGICIRIGVNSGSLEKNILKKYGSPTAEAIVESALYHASLLEKFDFNNIVLSLKSSNAETAYKAYSLVAEKSRYPLHLGVTEAGTRYNGIIKSSAVLGGLLLNGIGDTIRISLTDDPVEEVKAGIALLKSLGLRNEGPTIVSCPTCGRTRINLIKIADEVESRLVGCKKNIKVAVMGCVVNGPGEAREADIGIAGGEGCGVLIKKGEIIKKVGEDKLVDTLIEEIERM
ncbi:MAG: flavodoxin-dependent (E)-4-hydroxy-3-methylbut-2-enyl-diphosphate synthase [Acutalibacteraceae bacterium]|nr:flavodoxin-dependent (E)-4-hydroxy-3-methylbut-2-enyl-diphosphate synthase [Acutalibacteraceae bacterium]